MEKLRTEMLYNIRIIKGTIIKDINKPMRFKSPASACYFSKCSEVNYRYDY